MRPIKSANSGVQSIGSWIAKPNTVAIDWVTRRLIGNLFRCRDLGALATKRHILVRRSGAGQQDREFRQLCSREDRRARLSSRPAELVDDRDSALSWR